MQIYNTLGREKQELIPISGKKIGMYVCGPTVYGPGHIGHARTYVAFDIIRRYLEHRGYKVRYVVNITDIHDDIMKRANEQHTTIFELADRNIKLFFEDWERLGIKKADYNPRVTETIPEIIAIVKELVKKGIAYETDDGIYFSVSKFPEYGKLSNIKIEKHITGTRVDTDKYEKEQARDFALWKKARPGEPSWDSPWGKGRPGWHIECSAMGPKYLGQQFDIHGGAVDLIFPHHENEIAQSEGASGKKPFVKYWMHTGFLNVEGEKMSKSLGNFITIPELLRDYKPKVFRFFIAGMHYRSGVDFSKKNMEQAAQGLERYNHFIEQLLQIAENGNDKIGTKNENNKTTNNKQNKEVEVLIKNSRLEFEKAMDDDFNAPLAWAAISEFVREMNKLIAEGNISMKDAQKCLQFMREIDSVFCAFTFEREKQTIDADVEKLIEERNKARKEKNWKRSDEIRDKLLKMGITLDDTPKGTVWHKAK